MRLIYLIFIVLYSHFAVAARPLITDDATTTDTGQCQIESWMQKNDLSHEFWALPNCGITDDLDMTIGAGYSNTGKTDYLFQMKYLLKPLTTESFGVGFVMGAVAHPEITRDANQMANYYAYVPLSVPLFNDHFFIHANLGWHYDRDIKEHNTTWGVAFETKLNSRWSSVGEIYGDYHKDTFWQTGLRYSIIPDVFQVDSSIGGLLHSGKEDRWISFGFHWVTKKLW